jgi:signal transduction histidine kinase
MKPRQDSFETLIYRLEQNGRELCRAKNMLFNVVVNNRLFKNVLSTEFRHQVYLLIKGAINNAVKYSGGNKIELVVKEKGGSLEFSVVGNGKGFAIETAKNGNGLKNMHERAEQIGAGLFLRSKENEGTEVSIECKIT